MSVEEDEAASKLVANERRKLSATYANGVAVAVFAVGGFAPFITTVLSSVSGAQSPFLVLGVMAICWMVNVTISSGRGLSEESRAMTIAQLFLMLFVLLGGGAIAVWVLWLDRRVTKRLSEVPDSASARVDAL